MNIKTFILSLQGKAILASTLFIIIFMAITGYTILSREKALYLKDRENQAMALVETAAVNFTNAILYEEVGLIEETGIIDHYINNLLNKEKNILTIIIFDNMGIVTHHCHLFEHGKFYKGASEIISHDTAFVRETNDKTRGPILEAITPLMVGTKRIATLRVEFSLKDFYAKANDLAKRILYITTIAAGGSIILVVLGINAMTKPIRKLSKAMDAIDYGRFEDFPIRYSDDEIGHLQKSFMEMVRRLKDADLQWENTFNSITDYMTIHDKDYRIVKANMALAQKLNTTPDGLKGKTCWQVFHNSNGPCSDCPHAVTLGTRKPSTLEIEYTSLSGIFLATTFPVFNEKGEIAGTVHVAKDITQEKRLQEKLIQSEKMAVMGQMTAGIAHEINNPLNSILGYATYLIETMSDTSPNKDELTRIAGAASRCKDAMQRFLNFARETPKSMEHVEVKEVVEEAMSLCYHILASQKTEFVREVDMGLWITVDKRQIEDVLVNMVLNACQSMETGGKLCIKAYKDEDRIKIEISDTGCGIPQENIKKIFDPFFTTKEPGKGTGLGLALSRTIIENHNGTIACQSTVGKGTTFTISLPRGEA